MPASQERHAPKQKGVFVIDVNLLEQAVPVYSKIGFGCSKYEETYEYRKTRLQVVKDVTSKLIDELQLSDDVNVGLMHFDASNNYEGGMVAIPVGRVSNNASEFKAELNGLYARSNTPLSETYYEAARYMKGQPPEVRQQHSSHL